MADRRTARPAVTGEMARTLAANLTGRGYRVQFPPGRDPAVFKVTGLPGEPYVEVTAEEDGSTGCFYMGQSTADAEQVIGKLPDHPGHPDVVVSTWEDIAVEWDYLPPDGRPADPGQITGLLLAHLAVLSGGSPDRKDT